MDIPAAYAPRNPLVNGAAVAIIVTCLVATAAMTGLLPVTHSERGIAAGEPVAAGKGDAADAPRLAGDRRPVPSGCAECGVVEAVRQVRTPGEASGAGAVAGGVAGATLGSQLGRGNGRTALGVLGAVGGAYAGNAIEKHVRARTVYRVTVRMQDGSQRTLTQTSPPSVGPGATVRVVDGVLAARG